MKRLYLFIAVFLLSAGVMLSACSKAEKEETPTEDEMSQEETLSKEEPEGELLIAVTEDPQIAIDNEMTLEYLSFLGLDETYSYTLRDTFPTGIDEKKSYLVNVTNISEDDFATVQQALQDNGFSIISDIMEDTEKQFRSYQYSNSSNLYIEIGYSYGASYFDVHFVPIS